MVNLHMRRSQSGDRRAKGQDRNVADHKTCFPFLTIISVPMNPWLGEEEADTD